MRKKMYDKKWGLLACRQSIKLTWLVGCVESWWLYCTVLYLDTSLGKLPQSAWFSFWKILFVWVHLCVQNLRIKYCLRPDALLFAQFAYMRPKKVYLGWRHRIICMKLRVPNKNRFFFTVTLILNFLITLASKFMHTAVDMTFISWPYYLMKLNKNNIITESYIYSSSSARVSYFHTVLIKVDVH